MTAAAELSLQEWRQNGYVISTDPALLQVGVVHDYLSRLSYWAANRPLATVERALAHSRCYGLYRADGAQVGFARCVSDFATFAYLADVFVLPEEQGRGLGKWLVSCVLADPELDAELRWTLYTRDAHTLYARFGFVAEPRPEDHMILRKTAPANAQQALIQE